jgi:hypothetical protein
MPEGVSRYLPTSPNLMIILEERESKQKKKTKTEKKSNPGQPKKAP